jgi:hypothetical protein
MLTDQPDGSTSVFNGATAVYLPYTLLVIGNAAFRGCTTLTICPIPNFVHGIGSYAFYGCESLPLPTIPASVTGFGSYAFYRCGLTKLNDISTCTKLTTIGNRVFYYCEKLTGTITIPASVTKVGERTFRYTQLSINFADTNGWWVTENSDYTGGTALTSTDLATNSTVHLKTTYYTYFWYKQ